MASNKRFDERQENLSSRRTVWWGWEKSHIGRNQWLTRGAGTLGHIKRKRGFPAYPHRRSPARRLLDQPHAVLGDLNAAMCERLHDASTISRMENFGRETVGGYAGTVDAE
jgi:hypothetical protein